MPASSSEVIGAALQSSFRHKSGPLLSSKSSSTSDLEDQLIASGKQVLLNDVKYDKVDAQQSLLYGSLKKKYVHLNASSQAGTSLLRQNSSPGALKSPLMKSSPCQEETIQEPRVVLWSKDKVILGWKKNFHPGTGMLNLGNTCYINSSLQALFHIPALANWLLDEDHISQCESNNMNITYCSVCAMIRTLKASLDRSAGVIKPMHIHHKLKCKFHEIFHLFLYWGTFGSYGNYGFDLHPGIGKTLVYGRQEDAHEFIKVLLDHMDKSYLCFRRAMKLDHRSKETTPLNQIFGGYMRQQVSCPLCHHVSTTFSHFQDLVLDIRNVSSLEEALNLYFRKETLDSENAYKCEKCHKKVPATKRYQIERAPFVLLIQLKRFTSSGGKICKHVNIQRVIELSKYISGSGKLSNCATNPYQYKLVSMVIHLGGSQHGGHYTAVAESSTGNLYEFDDASVRPITVPSALFRNPYILFYEMMHKPKPSPSVKQVIRQSSDKALLVRSSSEGSSHPLPTSHSTSFVANGYKDHNSRALNKALLNKDRERISFGIKVASNDKTGNTVKPSKFITCSGGVSSHTRNVSVNGPVITNKGDPSKAIQSVRKDECKGEKSESLVPYLNNSDSDNEDSINRNKGVNNHDGLCSNARQDQIGTSQNVKLEDIKSFQGNLDNNELHSGINGHTDDSGELVSENVGDNKVMEGIIVPKSVDYNNVNSSLQNCCGSDISKDDASVHSKKNCVNFLSEEKCSVKASKTQIWTVTSQCPLPELEKSYSQDSAILNHYPSNSDTDSLRSKESVDSGRSSKSMKMSLLSLLPCIASRSSPSHSPDVEVSSVHVEEKNGMEGQQESATDTVNAKRNWDIEDLGSPSKKCCPDDSKLPVTNSGCTSVYDQCNGFLDEDGSVEDKHYSEADGNFCLATKKKRSKKKGELGFSEDGHNRESCDVNNVLSDSQRKNNGSNYKSRSVTWDGAKGNDVVKHLQQASSFAFGTKVKSWDGALSCVDEDHEQGRKQLMKRSLDDVYNEEYDIGRIKKRKKHKEKLVNQEGCEMSSTFQFYQDRFNLSHNGFSNHHGSNSANSSSYNRPHYKFDYYRNYYYQGSYGNNKGRDRWNHRFPYKHRFSHYRFKKGHHYKHR